MPVGEEEIGVGKTASLTAGLEAISGKYGDLERRVDGTLVSNDEGYKNISGKLKEVLVGKQGEFALLIGSGGVLSILPDLPTNTVLVVDKNPAVLEYNQMVQTLVLESDSPEEVWEKLSGLNLEDRFQVVKDIRSERYREEINLALINKEAREYGDYHWTSPDRFHQVKEALKRKDIVYVSADVVDEGFSQALQELAKKYNTAITFANFSNLHSWLEPKTMEFIKNWPFSKNAAILYSCHKGALLGDYPRMHIAQNPEEYIRETI